MKNKIDIEQYDGKIELFTELQKDIKISRTYQINIDILNIIKQILQKMVEKQKIYMNLYQNYSEFVEFLNDYHVSKRVSLFLIYLPSLTIFSDLFRNIGEGHFLRNASNFNITSLFFDLKTQIYWLFILLIVLLLISLLMPILMLLTIGINTLVSIIIQNQQIGYFYSVYTYSLPCKLIRINFVFNQKVFFPIITSLGIKFMLTPDKYSNPVLGVLFLVLSLLNCIIYDYYTLQIPSTKHFSQQYKQINFPYVILESILILITIILVNVTTGLTPFICCVCLFCVRIISNHFLPFETGQFYYQSRFSLFCGVGFSLALSIGYYTSQYSIMSICAVIVTGLLFMNKKYPDQCSLQYKKINSKEEITIEDMKISFSEEKISKTFKDAVIILRRKNSHRDELTIKILKNKCFHLQRESRGSIKTANSLLLLQYQQRIVTIIKKFLKIQDKAIETLNIMKNKQPKQQLLIKAVIQLVDLINQNKLQFIRCMNINLFASEILILMKLFFRQLYNDNHFIRDTNTQLCDEAKSSKNKIIQKQLFNKDTAVVVIDVLDEVGKITSVSNNMPNLLGYQASSLIGLSINELIPLSVRKYHDQVLTKFVEKFTSQVARNRPIVQFFAYTKSFHLQKVQIRYNFFLHLYDDCLLSGIIRKLNTQDYLIMTDKYGNIEGWTPSVGELFNFDEIVGTQCNAYNLFPLMPAFIKSNVNEPICFKTIFFRLSTMKNPKLMLFDFNKVCPDNETLSKKQIDVFMDLLQKGQIIQGYLAVFEINIINLQMCQGTSIKLIQLSDIKRIQNFQLLESAIIGMQSYEEKNQEQFGKQFGFIPEIRQDKSFDESEDTQYSLVKISKKQQIVIDLNFTLDSGKPNALEASQLKFNREIQKFQNIYSSRSLLKIEFDEDKDEIKYTSENLVIESTFDPKIERKSSFIIIVIIVTMVVLGILIQDQISLSVVFQNMNKNRTELAKANRAEVIFLKTVFNPNKTYIQQFKNGNLFISSPWLLSENMTYLTFDNVTIQQNLFYIANVQIPSIIDRIYKFRLNSSLYQKQLSNNFYNMVLLYNKIFMKQKQIWTEYIEQKKKQCIYKVIALTFSSIIYLLFLIFIHKRYQSQRKMTEAFFKFEKSDLDEKISSIKSITAILEKKCQDWFVDQQINQIKKLVPKKEQTVHIVQNSSLKKIANANNSAISQQQINQKKAQAQILNQIQAHLSKKRLYYMIGLISLVFCTQAIFLILYGVLTNNILNSLQDMVWKFDEAYLLAVYPNLKIASLFISAPLDILHQYEQSVQSVLEQTNQYMPDLFNLLSQTPCQDCPFMSQILNTNYRSFYSYFIQIMQNYNVSSSNLTQLYMGVDVVVQKVTQALTTNSANNPSFISLISIFSLIVFFVSVFIILRNLEQQCSKLQYFLKFFDVQALLKNKHMSTIMAKNM